MDSVIEVVDEKVFSDGSGAVGTYKIYGRLYTGIHTGVPNSATAQPWDAPRNGYSSRKAQGMVSSACRKVEIHMEGLCK